MRSDRQRRVPAFAIGALSRFLMNLICVNIAGVTTFVMQSIHPASWWKRGRAVKATRVAIALVCGAVAGLVGLILLLGKC